ncbi:hypothetical protein F511_14640 [Dorcoceras hygrometricum]|uniref:Uncharacterized protein n=1 Tax=Dorcoceras hygrometricum TaxID=472368 RepID=A0A2Z7ACD2_9LAMI|nr:hypothetical protein F511_14640 [Dorcoceras hygrometricum]
MSVRDDLCAGRTWRSTLAAARRMVARQKASGRANRCAMLSAASHEGRACCAADGRCWAQAVAPTMAGRCTLAMPTGCAMVEATMRDDAPVAHRIGRLYRASHGRARPCAARYVAAAADVRPPSGDATAMS